jgi:hypothetical protein
MIDFSIMDAVVADICKSLEDGIDEWEFRTCTINKKGTNTEYWVASGVPVTEIWSRDGGASQVFSKEQGLRIRYALCKRKEIIASNRQRELIQSFSRHNDLLVHPDKEGVNSIIDNFRKYINWGKP